MAFRIFWPRFCFFCFFAEHLLHLYLRDFGFQLEMSTSQHCFSVLELNECVFRGDQSCIWMACTSEHGRVVTGETVPVFVFSCTWCVFVCVTVYCMSYSAFTCLLLIQINEQKNDCCTFFKFISVFKMT